MANSNNAILAMNPYGPNIMDSFFNSLTNMSNIQNTRARTKQSNLLNAFTEATQPGAIDWENTKNQLNTQYYPQEKRVGLDQLLAGLGLTNAQASHQNALTQQARAQTGLLTRKEDPFGQFNLVLDAYNRSENDSPQKQYYSSLLNKMMGMQPTAGLGGMPAAASAGASGAPGNMSMANWVKDPRTGQVKSAAGGVFVNPQTGEARSSLTTGQSTKEQRTIAGIKNLESYLDEITKTVPEFMTFSDKLALDAQKAGNYYLGKNYEGPSLYAEGQSNILKSAEGFINAFGLNATNENVEKAINIMTPLKGESKQGYINRNKRQLKEFIEQRKRAESRLNEGVPVGQSNMSFQQGGFFSPSSYVPPAAPAPAGQGGAGSPADPLGIR